MADKRAQLAMRIDRSGSDDPRSERIRADLARLRAHLDAAGARANDTQSFAGARLSKLQARMPPDTAVLAFWYGDTFVYAWTVTREAIRVHRLSASNELAKLIEKTHRALASENDSPDSSRLLNETYVRLIAPLAEVHNKPRWIIIPDGPLNLLAFNALTEPETGAPVLARHVVSFAPATRLAVIQDRATLRPSWKALVVGDPIFNRDDPRLPAHSTPLGGSAVTQRAFSFQSLQRLPASAQEARQIAQLLASKGKVDLLLGADATRERVLGSPLGDYDLIHFASHTVIDVEYPQLSAIALSRFNREGVEQPYLLRAADLSFESLRARLVVMSACETALGKMTTGEGLLGFSYYLLSRGSRNVVGSLWSVPDQTTSELMLDFYRQLARGDVDIAEALTLASRSLARSLSWRRPHAWSAFALYQMQPVQ
jgi:CHAT domain-containing protein